MVLPRLINLTCLDKGYVVALPISPQEPTIPETSVRTLAGLSKDFWILMASTFAANLMAQGFIWFLPNYLIVLGKEAAIMGIVLTVGSFVVAILSPFGGYAGDMYGRRRMLVLSPIVASLGWFVLAMSGNWVIAALGFSLVQAPATVAAPSVSACIGDVVADEKLGRAYGILGSVLNLAAVAGPVLVGALIDAYGFQVALLAVAVVTLLSAALRLLLRETVPSEAALRWRSIPTKMRASLRSPVIRYTVALQAAYFAVLYISYPLVPIVMQKVYEYEFFPVGLVGSFGNLVFAAVSAVGGRMTETGNRRAMLAVNLAGRTAFFVLFPFYSSLPGLLAIVALHSIATPFLIPMTDSFIARETRKEERGTVFGFLRTWIALGQIPAMPAGGYIFDNFGYRAPFLVSASLMIPVVAYALTALPSKERTDRGPGD